MSCRFSKIGLSILLISIFLIATPLLASPVLCIDHPLIDIQQRDVKFSYGLGGRGRGSLIAEGYPGWILVAEHGFGETSNTMVYDFAFFRDKLFIGTFNMASGAEIWYTEDGLKWEKVVSRGFGNPNNWAVRLFTYKDKLYAGTMNYRDGLEIWVSEDGLNFNKIVGDGFENGRCYDVNYPIVFKDRLIIIASSAKKLGIEVWISDDGLRFRRVVEGGMGDKYNKIPYYRREAIPFQNMIYIGTMNSKSGGEIWRTSDGESWERVVDNGLRNKDNMVLEPSLIFKNKLYAITTNLNGLEIFRTDDGLRWEKVVEKGFGYGKYNNVFGSFNSYKDTIYLITQDADRRYFPGNPKGFQLWASKDGEVWRQIGENGFGNIYNYGGTLNIISDKFYVFTHNYKDGCEVWESDDGENWREIFKEEKGRGKSYAGGGLVEFNNHILLFIYDNDNGFDIWRYGPLKPVGVTTSATTTSVIETTTRSKETTMSPSTTTTLKESTSMSPISTTSPSKTTIKTEVTKSLQTMAPKTSTLKKVEKPSGVITLVMAIGGVAAGAAIAIIVIKFLMRPPPPPPPTS